MDSGRDLPKGGVSPFGHPRINDRSHLPAAFRSVPRPSSPLGAKASTERPFHAPDRNRHRPHAGPSRAQRRARTIPHERPWKPHRPRAHTHTLKTTQPIPDSPVKEQKPRRRMTPARPVFWKRSRCGRTAEATRPIRGIPMRADIEHPPHTPCGMRDTSRMSGHREWRTEPVEDTVIVRTDHNRNARGTPSHGLILERR
jgi:hypothetical protein